MRKIPPIGESNALAIGWQCPAYKSASKAAHRDHCIAHSEEITMKITALSLLFGSTTATMRNSAGAPLQVKSNYDVERQLSGSGDMAVDMADMDDDGTSGTNTARYAWYTAKTKTIDFSGYNIMPKKCML